MTVFKLKNGKWACKFRYTDGNGKRIQKMKQGFTLKREAEEWERDFLKERQFQPSMLFKNLVKMRENDTQIREHTRINREYMIKNRILPYFGDIPVNEITPNKVKSWQNSLIKQGFSQGYINTINSLLVAIFNYACRYHKLNTNPAHIAGSPKVPDNGEKIYLVWTLEDFKTAITVIDDLKAKTAITLLYWSGMRKGEMFALQWGDVDLNEKRIVISKSFQRLRGRDIITPTKTGNVRSILLPDTCIEAIKYWKDKQLNPEKDMAVIPYGYRFIEKAIKKAHNELGVPRITIHGLRHSHASFLISQGVNIALISKRLGHSKISMTLDTYSHFFPQDEESFIDKINQQE